MEAGPVLLIFGLEFVLLGYLRLVEVSVFFIAQKSGSTRAVAIC